ncbi:hypothetical protein ES705_06879 [subsurface metagenome]
MNKRDYVYKLSKLIEKYDNLTEKEREKKEANVRKDFIDPFFEILGWDIRDSTNSYEAETNVGKSGIVDVSIKIDGLVKVYQEAKKWSENLHGKQIRGKTKISEPIEKQLLQYCFEQRIDWGILTNFIEIRVFYIPEDLEVLNLNINE